MAKRQQQQDFLPSKALQPQQQIFDQYNAPKQFIAPRSELEDIGSALAGLSPTLKKFEERDKAEDAAAMNLAASKMSIDELRAASKRDFIGLQKKGVIPEGASPWAKVALLEAAGKRLVSQTVLPELYKNLDRLSDPNNNESPEQFARSIMEAQGIDSLYAANAAEEALQPVIAQFSNRVGEAKAKRTAVQNRNDLTDDIAEIAGKTKAGEEPSYYTDLATSIKERIQTAYTTLGISGRTEAWKGVESAAKKLARDGQPEAAHDLLEALEDMPIGTSTFGKDFSGDISELEATIDQLGEDEEDEAYNDLKRDRAMAAIKTEEVARELHGQILRGEIDGKSSATRPQDLLPEIQAALEAKGITDPSAISQVITNYESYRGKTDTDNTAVVERLKRYARGSMALPEFITEVKNELAAGNITEASGEMLFSYGETQKDKSAEIKSLKQDDTTFEIGINKISAEFRNKDGEAGLSNLNTDEEFDIMQDYQEAYQAIVTSAANNPKLDEAEKLEKIRKETAILSKDTLALIRSGVVTETASPVLQQVTEERAKRTIENSLEPALFKSDAPWYYPSSDLWSLREALQEATKESEKLNIQSKMYESAKNASKFLPGVRQSTGPGGYVFIENVEARPEEWQKFWLARSITGFTDAELEAGSIGKTKIPEIMLNPKYTILLDGFETEQEWTAFATAISEGTATDAQKKRWDIAKKVLPVNLQSDDDTLLKHQTKLYMSYRNRGTR